MKSWDCIIIFSDRGPAIVVNRRGGATSVMDSINHMFLMSRMIVPGSTYWNFGVGLEKGDVEKSADAYMIFRPGEMVSKIPPVSGEGFFIFKI